MRREGPLADGVFDDCLAPILNFDVADVRLVSNYRMLQAQRRNLPGFEAVVKSLGLADTVHETRNH